MRTFDDLVVGQGLAGTTLAWRLRHRGRSVLVIDRDASVTASSVAAGLITPVTGQRLAVAWRWHEHWSAACTFYEQVEQETGVRFFRKQPMVRILTGPEERQRFESRRPELGELVRSPRPPLDAASFHVRHGAFEMPHAGQLNVPRYLQASRERWIREGSYATAAVDPRRDVALWPDGVELPRLGVRAQRLTWCLGPAARGHPAFGGIDFTPAKGEVLRLRIRGLTDPRTIHRGVWLAPAGGDSFLAGATYDWDSADGIPTPAGRDELTAQLAAFLRLPFTVTGHMAAVRPALRDFRPVIGVHPRHPRMAVFNGLGSRGALSAPALAHQLVRCLEDGTAIDPQVNVTRWLAPPPEVPPERVRLTEQAHRLVRQRLRPGEFAVDATAGNGRDTAFLAQAVGPSGRVVAFDIQEEALARTSQRLKNLGLSNVTLRLADHAGLSDALPAGMQGHLSAVMFNLGYLPGGDHAVITQPASTIRALHATMAALRPGGIVTVVAYPGHGGGAAEMKAVENLLRDLPVADWEVGQSVETRPGDCSPRLFYAIRRSPSGVDGFRNGY